MSLTADLFWSFRSPYSYLAIGRYRALAASHDVTINLRPVYPLAIRQPDFFERNHPNWLRYTVLDMPYRYEGVILFDAALARVAAAHGTWINVWTVDEEVEMRRCVLDGVGGVMTDRPDVLRAVLDSA